MPNHIRNRLTFTAQIPEILAFMRSEDREFDFNKLVPMPPIYKHITNGWRRGFNGVQLHPYVTKTVLSNSFGVIQWDNDNKVGITSEGWFVNTGYDENPAPHEVELFRGLNTEELIATQNMGHPTWYEWCCDNWGTKWNAYDIEILHTNPGTPDEECTILFDTAWSGVPTLMEKLSAEFPTVTFQYAYADEDMGNNCGFGYLIGGGASMTDHDNGSEEAYQLYFDLHPGTRDNYIKTENGYEWKE